MMTNVSEPIAKAPMVRAVKMSFVRAMGTGETMVWVVHGATSCGLGGRLEHDVQKSQSPANIEII